MKLNIPPRGAHRILPACAILLAFAAPQTLLAQKSAAAARPAPAAAASPGTKPVDDEEGAAKPNKPGSEGIKVHGHWVLQVKNADGTMGERREFENSLVTSGASPSGSQIMAGLLTGDFTAGDPTVTFVQSPLPGNDATSYCASDFCGFLTTIHTSVYASGVGQTGLSAVVQFSPTVNWTLTGSYKIPSGLTSIAAVQVWLDTCLKRNFGPWRGAGSFVGSADDRAADVASESCTGTGVPTTDYDEANALTSTLVQNASGTATPLKVSAGQVISVTVVISFS